MQVLREITDWGENRTSNHDYIVSTSDKLLAYRKASGGNWEILSGKMRFDRSRRKFLKLDEEVPEELKVHHFVPAGALVYKSSNGNEYMVIDGTCTCPGYKFRGKCKHLELVKN